MFAKLHRQQTEASGLEAYARSLAMMEAMPAGATFGPHRQHVLGAISRSLYGLGEDSAAAAFAVEASALHPTPQPTEAPTLEQSKPSKRKPELLLNLQMFS